VKWREKSLTVFYHSLFDFPLKEEELLRWQPGPKALSGIKSLPLFDCRDGFYFLRGRADLIEKRLSREKILPVNFFGPKISVGFNFGAGCRNGGLNRLFSDE